MRRGDRVGRYKIEGLLGQGAMGKVHVATDEHLRRRVALKTLHDTGDLAATATLRLRFLREARAAAALQHPNAVTVYEVGEHEGMPFIAMELVRGSTFAALATAKIDLESKLRWLRDTADVLAAAHRVGLVHRDIKPENLMVSEDGVVKVLDFGVVKRIRRPAGERTMDRSFDLTAQDSVIGTPRYMAPEAFDGVVGPGTDQFAWGLVAYELITGRRAFPANPPSVPYYDWLLSVEPTPITDIVADLPEPFARVIMRAMSKSARNRFPSMDIVVQRLETCLSELPDDDRPTIRLAVESSDDEDDTATRDDSKPLARRR